MTSENNNAATAATTFDKLQMGKFEFEYIYMLILKQTYFVPTIALKRYVCKCESYIRPLTGE